MPIIIMHDIRKKVRDELIAELREALAAHMYRCDPADDAERCLYCGVGAEHEQHRGDAPERLREILGEDLPIYAIAMNDWMVTIYPRDVARALAIKAGRMNEFFEFLPASEVSIAEAAE